MPKRSGPGSTTRGNARTDLEAKSFGQALSVLRTERNLSQTFLATQLDRSPAYISLLENGRRLPTTDLIDKLAHALRLPPGSDEVRALRRSAGFESDDVSGVIRRITDVIGQKFRLGESQRWIILTDIKGLVDGWVELFSAQSQFDQGQFVVVADSCESLLAQRHWSPTLHTNMRMLEAATLSHLGDSISAERIAKDAATQVEKGAVGPAAHNLFDAELNGLRGLIAADRGDFEDGELLLKQSISLYQKLLTNKKSLDETMRALPEDIAFIGLGSSYKRLADITILRGEHEQAFSYCLTAESYLMRANQSKERDHWLRRVAEQKAWIFTKSGDFEEALQLREATRQELLNAQDTYGVIRNALFTGNDHLSRLKAIVREKQADAMNVAQSVTNTQASDNADPFIERRRVLYEALQDEETHKILLSAKEHYRNALKDLGDRGPQFLLGLCLRKLATALRYEALRDNNAETYKEASELLVRALTIEQSIGYQQHIAAVYEALADLEGDRDHLVNAHHYYIKGIEALNSIRGVSNDSTVERQLERLAVAAQEVELRNKQINDNQRGMPFTRGMVGPVDTWQALCNRLVDKALKLITTTSSKPVATSNRDDGWIKIVFDLESQSGGRRIFQNGLSDGLTDKVRAGFSFEGARIHKKRFKMLQDAIQQARLPGDQNQDLCCRQYVERELLFEGTAELTRSLISQALDWMNTFPGGYRLESSANEAPLSFFVKGSRILFEIPSTMAPRFLEPEELEELEKYNGSVLCYDIAHEQGADELRAIFDEFVKTANDLQKEAPAHTRVTTLDWLGRLQDSQLTTPDRIGNRFVSGK